MSHYFLGVDVGGAAKGYHAALIQDRRVESLLHATDAHSLCDSVSVFLAHRSASLAAAAIDGPAAATRKSMDIRRPEAELASRGYRMLYTPREAPNGDHWMQMSAKLHREIGRRFKKSRVVETYPSAIADRLYGLDIDIPVALLQDRKKRKHWPDYMDAVLCAHAARLLYLGEAEMLQNTGKDIPAHKPLALPQFEITKATIAFILSGKKVLLGMKKKGFGAGYWNGFGGKIEFGETPKQAARREIQEECGLICRNPGPAGKLYFHFDDDPRRIEGFIFRAREFSGNPVETEEMAPRWFPVNQLPLDEMWEDDRFWLPHVLAGKEVRGTFRFKNKKMDDFSLEVL